MTEKPIMLNGDMVRAVLAGRKTQARLPVEGMPPDAVNVRLVADRLKYGRDSDVTTAVGRSESPYGWIDDRLYVQEEWAHVQPEIDIVRSDGRSYTDISDAFALYSADGYGTIEDARRHCMLEMGSGCSGLHIRDDAWLPAHDMPIWASRITLRITDVRVERLQDIGEWEARAEGVAFDNDACDHQRQSCDDVGCLGRGHRSAFHDLWASIYGTESREANPWVWAFSFEKAEVFR